MKLRYAVIAWFGLCLIWSSCASTKPHDYDDHHTSQNSLDWAGAYRGAFPCADCEGINTFLQLNENSTYRLYQKPIGKEGAAASSSGQFTWQDNGRNIILDHRTTPFKLQVGENKLFLLDAEGKPVTGPLKDKYVLTKEENSITEKYWKLMTLKGKSVKADGSRDVFIILKQDSGHFKGHDGCNDISGSYQLSQGNHIKFSNIHSTEIACKALNTERTLIEVLREANNFILLGDTLLLNVGQKAVANFEAVYLR